MTGRECGVWVPAVDCLFFSVLMRAPASTGLSSWIGCPRPFVFSLCLRVSQRCGPRGSLGVALGYVHNMGLAAQRTCELHGSGHHPCLLSARRGLPHPPPPCLLQRGEATPTEIHPLPQRSIRLSTPASQAPSAATSRHQPPTCFNSFTQREFARTDTVAPPAAAAMRRQPAKPQQRPRVRPPAANHPEHPRRLSTCRYTRQCHSHCHRHGLRHGNGGDKIKG